MQRAMTSRNFRARWLANVPVLGHMLGLALPPQLHPGRARLRGHGEPGIRGSHPPWAAESRSERPTRSSLTSILAAVIAIRVAAWVWSA